MILYRDFTEGRQGNEGKAKPRESKPHGKMLSFADGETPAATSECDCTLLPHASDHNIGFCEADDIKSSCTAILADNTAWRHSWDSRIHTEGEPEGIE
jgi:hypothetical protein